MLIPINTNFLTSSKIWERGLRLFESFFHVLGPFDTNDLRQVSMETQSVCAINPRAHLLFAILDRTWGGGGSHLPRLVCPLIEIELRNKNKRKDRDVLNLTMPDFTTLRYILTFPGQVKHKMLFFWKIKFSANNFWTKEDREKRKTPA